jgi:outer membrane protein assembly factor BamB
MLFLLPACSKAPQQESSPDSSTTDTLQITDSAIPEETLPLEFGEPPVGSILWETAIESDGVKLHLFVEGRLVVWDAYGSVRSFDPITGEAGWVTDLDPNHDTNIIDLVWPTSSAGRLHLIWNRTLWTLRLSDGEVEWVAPGHFAQLAAAGERVATLGPYPESGPVPVNVFDAETGATVWTDEQANVQQISMTETVVAGARADALNTVQFVAWDASTGDPAWSGEIFQPASPLTYSLAIPAPVHRDDAMIFAFARFLASIDAPTGATLWTREMDDEANVFAEPMSSGGWVVTNQDDAPEDTEEQFDSIVGIDPRTGTNAWSLRVSTRAEGAAVYPFCGTAASTTSAVFNISSYESQPFNLVVDTLQGQPLWQIPGGYYCPTSTDGTRVFVIEPGAQPLLVAYGPPESP